MGCHLWGHTQSDATEATQQSSSSLIYASLMAQLEKNLSAMQEEVKVKSFSRV